jgi:septal ring factor EnvC (AmiA/AmiB activator)
MVAIVVVFAGTAFLFALGVGFLLGYYASVEKDPDLSVEVVSRLKEETADVRSIIGALSTELKDATSSLSAAREENARLEKRVAELTRHYLDQAERMRLAEQRRNEPQVGALRPPALIAGQKTGQ